MLREQTLHQSMTLELVNLLFDISQPHQISLIHESQGLPEFGFLPLCGYINVCKEILR